MKPKPDTKKQLHYHGLACAAGKKALLLYAVRELRAALPQHREMKRHESAWRAYGRKGRISLRADGDRLL